jgi:hypothetical protein
LRALGIRPDAHLTEVNAQIDANHPGAPGMPNGQKLALQGARDGDRIEPVQYRLVPRIPIGAAEVLVRGQVVLANIRIQHDQLQITAGLAHVHQHSEPFKHVLKICQSHTPSV